MTRHIPPLAPHCGSWVVIDRATGKAVLEIFDRKLAERLNFDKYRLETAGQWLPTLSKGTEK